MPVRLILALFIASGLCAQAGDRRAARALRSQRITHFRTSELGDFRRAFHRSETFSDADSRLGGYRAIRREEKLLQVFTRLKVHQVVVRTVFEGENHDTEVVRVETRGGLPPKFAEFARGRKFSKNSEVIQDSTVFVELLDQQMNAVEFAEKQLSLRRSGWKDYLPRLYTAAVQTSEYSSYVLVREKPASPGQTGALLGVARLIQSYYRKAPGRKRPATGTMTWTPRALGRNDPEPLWVERYLGIRLPRPLSFGQKSDGRTGSVGYGTVYEPGIWAIRKDANLLGFTETLTHMLRIVLDGDDVADAERSKMLYAFGDPATHKLHQLLGLESAGFEPILKDGVKWSVVKFTPAHMAKVLENLDRYRPDVDTEEAKRYRERLHAVLLETLDK
jgi:hypothetical protein